MPDQKHQPSYSERLSVYFAELNKESFTVAEIQESIKDFCKLEYKKIKERSDIIPFGKYKGKSVKLLCTFDRQYVDWLLDKQKLDNYPVIKRDVYNYLKELDTE